MMPLFVTSWQDIIGTGIVQIFGNAYLIALFIFVVFLMLMYIFGMGAGLVFVIGTALILLMSAPGMGGGLLPPWFGMFTVLGIAGLVMMAILRFLVRQG
jgi:hypothetical protein